MKSIRDLIRAERAESHRRVISAALLDYWRKYYEPRWIRQADGKLTEPEVVTARWGPCDYRVYSARTDPAILFGNAKAGNRFSP